MRHPQNNNNLGNQKPLIHPLTTHRNRFHALQSPDQVCPSPLQNTDQVPQMPPQYFHQWYLRDLQDYQQNSKRSNVQSPGDNRNQPPAKPGKIDAAQWQFSANHTISNQFASCIITHSSTRYLWPRFNNLCGRCLSGAMSHWVETPIPISIVPKWGSLFQCRCSGLLSRDSACL